MTPLIEVARDLITNDLAQCEPGGDPTPFFAYRTKEGDGLLGVFTGDSDDAKDVICQYIVATIAVYAPSEGVFGTCAWMVRDSEEMPQGSLANHPDRQEVVTLFHGSADGKSAMWFAPVIRPEDSAPQLGEWGFELFDTAEGRFPEAIAQGFHFAANMPPNIREDVEKLGADLAVEAFVKAMGRAA